MHSFAVVALFGLVAAASAGFLGGYGYGGFGHGGYGYGGLGYGGYGVSHVVPAVSKVVAAPVVAPVAVHAGYARAHTYSTAVNHGAVVGKVVAPVAVGYGHGLGLGYGYGGYGYGAKLW